MKRISRISHLSLFFALFAFSCKTTNNSGLSADQNAAELRAREIHQSIVDKLRATSRSTEGTIWFESNASFARDWIVQSPENYWGRLGNELPVRLDCDGTLRDAAGNETGEDPSCDPQFSRHTCSTDADCAPYNASCQDFLPSVKAPGEAVAKMCLGSGDSLLNRFYATMVSAKIQLEVTSLSYPTGRFFEMTVNALAFLSHQPQVPTIRLLYSGRVPVTLNNFDRTSTTLAKLVAAIEERGGDLSRLRIDLGWLSSKTQFRWNHSKIIVADQFRVLEGGHNPWDVDYLRDQPIFDLSLEASGPLGVGTSRYVDRIWKDVDDWSGYSSTSSSPRQIVHGSLPAQGGGKSRVIGLGRTGTNILKTNKADNAADDGLRFLIDSAKTSLYITQQDFFQGAALKIGNLPIPLLQGPWAIENLTNAVKRGVKLNLVKSDQPGIAGYGIVGAEDSYKGLVDAFTKGIRASDIRDLNGRTVRQYVCDQVTFLPWRFNTSEKAWPVANGKALGIGAHSKLIIADESVFALGSQNLYPANLQEFTFLVSDPSLTKDLLDNYWKPLWSNSEWSKLPCK